MLAHFTASALLPQILSQGLLPRSLSRNGIQDDLDTDPGCVYLSAKLDKFYMARAQKQFGGEGVAIVVEVDAACIRADENSLSNAQRLRLRPEEHLPASFALLGSCKYEGVISPDRFVGIYNADGVLIWPS